jgi:hypothetical protein
LKALKECNNAHRWKPSLLKQSESISTSQISFIDFSLFLIC